MVRFRASWIGCIALFACSACDSSTPPGLIPDGMQQPPTGYRGPRFKPSYAFPKRLPAELQPWRAFDFKTQPEAFLNAVKGYVLAGQDIHRWDVARNKVRRWYHMPWMEPGPKGREYISGLTAERHSRRGELGPGQKRCRQNWGVGFFNPVGGYTLGQIWHDVAAGKAEEPKIDKPVVFPVGTVVAKVLYTEADATDSPMLRGAPTIRSMIAVEPELPQNRCPSETPAERKETDLRLIQLDVAVKVARGSQSGWVFGTFAYDGSILKADPCDRLRPVGLMWGNDFELSDADYAAGHRVGQSIVLTDLGLDRPFGRGGRMNGPIDNPNSACLSCHMTAQTPMDISTIAPASKTDWSDAKCWFRDLARGEAFGVVPLAGKACGEKNNEVALDYSLQLAIALDNIKHAVDGPKTGGWGALGIRIGGTPVPPGQPFVADGVEHFRPSREGTETQ